MTTPPTSPRPEPVAQARRMASSARSNANHCDDKARREGYQADERFLTALANALEDTKAERDRAHATLREIRLAAESKGKQGGWLAARVARLARERLENP